MPKSLLMPDRLARGARRPRCQCWIHLQLLVWSSQSRILSKMYQLTCMFLYKSKLVNIVLLHCMVNCLCGMWTQHFWGIFPCDEHMDNPDRWQSGGWNDVDVAVDYHSTWQFLSGREVQTSGNFPTAQHARVSNTAWGCTSFSGYMSLDMQVYICMHGFYIKPHIQYTGHSPYIF